MLLYDMLLHLSPSPVARLHRAVALRYTRGPRSALAEVHDLAAELGRYHLLHATRADLLRPWATPKRPAPRTASRWN